MRKQDYLVQLIHALSASEKRYFKLFNSPQKGAKKYERLFDELAKAEMYDATSLSKILKITPQQLADDKAYLQVVLLKALRNFNENRPYVSMMNQLIDVHLLIEKMIMPLANEMASKITQPALHVNHYEIAHQAYAFQMTASSYLMDKPRAKYDRDTQLLNQMENSATAMLRTIEFLRLQSQVMIKMTEKVTFANAADIEELDKLINHPLLVADYEMPVFNFYKYQTLGHLCHLKQDFAASLQHHINQMEIIEAKNSPVVVSGWNYVALISNLITAYLECSQFEAVERLIRKLKTRYYHAFIDDGKKLDPVIDAYSFRLLAAAYNKGYVQGKVTTSAIKTFITSFTTEYSTLKAYIDTENAVLVINTVARCCFWVKDYDGAIKWTLESQNNYPPSIKSDFQGTAKVWFAIIHAEMRNYALLGSLIRNTEVHLKKYKSADESDKITIRFLKKIASFKTEIQTQNAFRKLLNDYNNLEQSNAKVVRSKLAGYKKWAEERLVA